MDGGGMFLEQAVEASVVQCCNGLLKTKQSWECQDPSDYTIWAPKNAGIPSSSNGVSEKVNSASRTLVWWDTETCPPPSTECNAWDGIAHHLVRMLALPNMNRHETVTCIAYGGGEVSEPLFLALSRRGIIVQRRILPTCSIPGTRTTESMKSMIVDILFWALNNAPPAQVRIIADPNEPNFPKLVRSLRRRSYEVILAPSFIPSLTHPAIGNGEYFQASNFIDYWQSCLGQIPESDESTFSIEQLQQLHSCLLSEAGAPAALQLNPVEDQVQGDRTRPSMQVSTPRPTYKDIASGGEPSDGVSSLWKGDSITGCPGSVLPRASLADVGRWLENFVELQDSLYGMNISLMPKIFDRQGIKLDLKHLGFPSLSRLLLDNFSDTVRLKYPTKDCTFMFPAKLGAQALEKLITDFTDLLTDLLPKRDSESPMSLLKTAFRTRFQYELDHEAAGFIKLSQFLSSMPKLVRVRQCSTQGKELVICRPSVYFSKQRT